MFQSRCYIREYPAGRTARQPRTQWFVTRTAPKWCPVAFDGRVACYNAEVPPVGIYLQKYMFPDFRVYGYPGPTQAGNNLRRNVRRTMALRSTAREHPPTARRVKRCSCHNAIVRF